MKLPSPPNDPTFYLVIGLLGFTAVFLLAGLWPAALLLLLVVCLIAF